MNILQIGIIVFCGLLIGLAMLLLFRTLRRIAKGKCCEGCGGCPQEEQCSSRSAELPEQRYGKEL